MAKGDDATMPKVSVIMPSLNVVKYIQDCIDSVLGQTLEDIEVIVVDAGSTDGTLEILREYETRDSRVRVIVSDKKSYGYQMNLGLDAACGEYIGIVETDDFIERDMFERLVPKMDAFRLDYIKGYAHAFMDLSTGGRYQFDIDRNLAGEELTGKVICPSQMPELLLKVFHIWVGLYRRSFLKGIRFHETPGAAYQDIGFIIQTVGLAKRAMYLDIPVYNYRQDNTAASVFNRNGIRYLVEEYIWADRFLQDKDFVWRAFFFSRWFSQCVYRLHLMATCGSYWPEAEEAIAFTQKHLSVADQEQCIAYEDLGVERHALLRLFLVSPRDVFSYYCECIHPKQERLRKLLRWSNGHPVIVWGAGRWGQFIHAFLDQNGIRTILAFADNNAALWGQKIQGLPVISPQEAMNHFHEAYYLIANKYHKHEICQFLLEAQVQKQKIFWQPIDVIYSLLAYNRAGNMGIAEGAS